MSVATPLWRAGDPLVLASASAGRRALLESCGIPLSVDPADLDEAALTAGLRASGTAAGEVAAALAEAKARRVAARRPGLLVLGADQMLALGLDVLDKPASRAEAALHLTRLSGTTHHLVSAACLMRDGAVLWAGSEPAAMTMRRMDVAFIDRYLDAAGPAVLRSVGAYQVEGLGMHLFERIEGSAAAIIGLPLLGVLDALRRAGALHG